MLHISYCRNVRRQKRDGILRRMKDDGLDVMTSNSGPVKEAPAEKNLWLDPAVMDRVQEAVDAAVQAAQNVLPAMEEQRRQIAEALQKADAAVAKLRAIIDSKNASAPSPESGSPDPTFSLAGRDVDTILYESEDPLKVNEIIDRIKSKFGRDWASSTVYGHLTKLKTKDVVVNTGGRWVMTESGRDAVVF